MIDSVEKLTIHLKILKKKLLAEGVNQLELYPMFCIYYDKHKERYSLPKFQVLDVALDVFLEKD